MSITQSINKIIKLSNTLNSVTECNNLSFPRDSAKMIDAILSPASKEQIAFQSFLDSLEKNDAIVIKNLMYTGRELRGNPNGNLREIYARESASTIHNDDIATEIIYDKHLRLHEYFNALITSAKRTGIDIDSL